MEFSKNSHLNLFEVHIHALIPSVVSWQLPLISEKKVSKKVSPPVTALQVLGLSECSTTNWTYNHLISSITLSLSERYQLPPDLADTTNSFQLLPKRCGEVQAQLIPSAIPAEEPGCSCLHCNAALLWGYEQPRLNSVFKCHGGLWPWESHNESRLEPRASLPNCDHWLIDNPFMGCCSTIAVQQPIQSERQNQAQGDNSPPTSLKHGEIYCFHRNKSVWCPHSSCIPHWWASAPSCWGFKEVVIGQELGGETQGSPSI